MPRKKIDALVEFAKGYGAKGLAYVAIQEDGTLKSSFAKFMTDEQMAALVAAMMVSQATCCYLLLIRIRSYGMYWEVCVWRSHVSLTC